MYFEISFPLTCYTYSIQVSWYGKCTCHTDLKRVLHSKVCIKVSVIPALKNCLPSSWRDKTGVMDVMETLGSGQTSLLASSIALWADQPGLLWASQECIRWRQGACLARATAAAPERLASYHPSGESKRGEKAACCCNYSAAQCYYEVHLRGTAAGGLR